jgi:hypothetical protein
MTDLISPEEFPDFLKENRSVARYDASSEERLPHLWWTVDRAKIHEALKEIGDLVSKAIYEVPKDDLELQHILRCAQCLHQVPRDSPVKVALVGPQGAGKSLLINTLFNCDGLSLTGADGQACTSVIIRYLHHSGRSVDGEKPYTAEVTFFKPGKQEKMIEQHARSFFHVQHADEDSDEEDAARHTSNVQDELDRRLKDTAEEFFHTIFGGREQFQEHWNAEAYRSGEFVRLCQLKCDEALYPFNLDPTYTATFTAKSPRELLQKIKPFMAKVDGEACLWPLVEAITIRFQDDLLEQNIEIIDLPGGCSHAITSVGFGFFTDVYRMG